MTPLDVLQKNFGYTSFRNNQEAIIDRVLNKQDTFVLMPTGGGKSLCYQIPALIQNGLTIVISPLIALMKDQVDTLRINGVEAAYLNSTTTPEERASIFNALEEHRLKLLYVAPERLFNPQFIPFIKRYAISLFAIDEAHCISSWGHDFRPEYRQLSRLKTEFPGVPTLALTATADKITADDIVAKLALRDHQTFISSFNRANIHYRITPKRGMYPQLLDYLRKRRGEAGIIYALSRNSTEKLASDLTADGFPALPYHAGLSVETRSDHQMQFLKDETKIIVATIAFGMGINKSNVRFVVHADLPKNIESYYQETGRAGRDGLPSEALLFYSSGDVMKLKNFVEIDGNRQQSEIMLKKLNQMADLCETPSCRRQKILAYFGEQFDSNCASCDVCQSNYIAFDGTVIAQKALSAVARFETNYGLSYLVDFLRGSRSEKIKEWHKKLSTYGIGADTDKDTWIRNIKQLISQGYLEQYGAEYPIVRLTKKSEDVLRGIEKVQLLTIERKEEFSDTTEATSPDIDNLFRVLKKLRMEIAAAENVPAYIIFSDATLMELATYLPLNVTDLRKISGFGENKTERYGQQFLSAVQAYATARNLPTRIDQKTPKRERKGAERTSSTVLKTLELFHRGNNPEQIAAMRDLALTTIESHLAEGISTGEIKVTDIVTSGEKIARIMEAIQSQGADFIAPLKVALGDDISYGEIKAVVAFSKRTAEQTA